MTVFPPAPSALGSATLREHRHSTSTRVKCRVVRPTGWFQSPPMLANGPWEPFPTGSDHTHRPGVDRAGRVARGAGSADAARDREPRPVAPHPTRSEPDADRHAQLEGRADRRLHHGDPLRLEDELVPVPR